MAHHDDISHAQRVLIEATRKLRAGMDDGPYGQGVHLTNEEACMLWRTLDIYLPEMTEKASG